MPLRVLKSAAEEVNEREIQQVIERDLTVLEEGLEYVDSEVIIGSGRIDTLALDEDNRATFIEYKRPGDFTKDALIQLMDYLAWFKKDANRIAMLEKHMRSKKTDIEKLDAEVRVILVVSDASERVLNACYVIENHIKIFTYSVGRLDGQDPILLPREVLDNSDFEPLIPQARPEEDIVKPHFGGLYSQLKMHLTSLSGVRVYTRKKDIRASAKKVFCRLRFRKNWITVSTRVGQGKIKHPDFKYRKQGQSNWGSFQIEASGQLSDMHRKWLTMAYDFVQAEMSGDFEDEE